MKNISPIALKTLEAILSATNKPATDINANQFKATFITITSTFVINNADHNWFWFWLQLFYCSTTQPILGGGV